MWHGRFWRCYMTQLAATNEPLWAVQQLCDLGKKKLRYLSHPPFTKASIEILGSRLVYIRSMEWKSVFFRDWSIYIFLLSTNLPLQCLNRWHFPVIQKGPPYSKSKNYQVWVEYPAPPVFENMPLWPFRSRGCVEKSQQIMWGVWLEICWPWKKTIQPRGSSLIGIWVVLSNIFVLSPLCREMIQFD